MTSKLVTVEVPPSSHATLQVPIKPLMFGRLLIRARPTDESEDYLTAEIEIRQEGFEITESSPMMIDLSTRPYFMEALEVPVPLSYKAQNELTLTGGISGPIVPYIPFNISGVLNQPQITADEAIFILGQLHHYRENPEKKHINR